MQSSFLSTNCRRARSEESYSLSRYEVVSHGKHRHQELYPRIQKHVVEWVLIMLLLRGAYDVLAICLWGHL